MSKLTKRSVEALCTEAKDYLIWDRDLRGFGVRVYPSGKKTYLVRYRVGRRTRRITIGQHGALTSEAKLADYMAGMGGRLRDAIKANPARAANKLDQARDRYRFVE